MRDLRCPDADTAPAARDALRVLIVEDEPLIALDLEDTLSAMGHEVIGCAASSAGAMTAAEAAPVDVILTDLNLGRGGCGGDVVRYAAARGLPCIVITGNPMARPGAGPAEIDGLDVAGLIAKPFRDREVERALAGVPAAA